MSKNKKKYVAKDKNIQNQNKVSEEIKKEDNKKVEAKKEETKKEEAKKEEAKKEDIKKEEAKKEVVKKEEPPKEKPQKTVITNPHEKKKATTKDWILIGVSIFALLFLIFVVYSTRSYNNAVSQMLQNDSKKENFTVATKTEAIDSVIINEVSSEKWVELYNGGSDEADISGTQIFVSGKSVANIEDGTKIGPDSFVVVELSVNPVASEKNNISIIDKDGKLIDSLLVPKLSSGKTYGLTQNESFNIGFMAPSKGEKNKLELEEENYTYYDGIGFSTPGGFYDNSFVLSLSAAEGEKIYYTTDGTEPTKDSTEYTDGVTISNKSGSKYVYAAKAFGYLYKENYYPGSIDAGMVVRAIRVDGSGKVVGSATQEYYIGLANDSAYQNIPVLSLTVDPDEMFGYFDGMYVAGRTREDAIIRGEKETSSFANYLNDWSRDGQLSFYEQDKDKSFELSPTVKMYKDINIYSSQKSLLFNVEDYNVFEGSSLMNYIDQDGNILLQGYIDDDTAKVRDYFVNEMMKDSKVGTIDLTPCILFIDGEYWGVYLLKAPFEADYFERQFGVTKDVYVRQNGEYQKEFLDMYNFVTENDMSNKANYEQAKTMLDIDNYLEYVCLNVYLGNSNFRTTRGTQWRTVSSTGLGYTDGRWRWVMNYPIGNTMGKASTQTPSIDTFMQHSLRMDKFFQSLLMNDEFCSELVKKMDSMSNERFAVENWEKVLDDSVSLMKKTAMDSYIRFSGSIKDAGYMAEIEIIRNFLTKRNEYITLYTKELAENGGDLEFIREMEASGEVVTDEEGMITSLGEDEEGQEAEIAEEAEGENIGEAENADNAGNTNNAVNTAGQGAGNNG